MFHLLSSGDILTRPRRFGRTPARFGRGLVKSSHASAVCSKCARRPLSARNVPGVRCLSTIAPAPAVRKHGRRIHCLLTAARQKSPGESTLTRASRKKNEIAALFPGPLCLPLTLTRRSPYPLLALPPASGQLLAAGNSWDRNPFLRSRASDGLLEKVPGVTEWAAHGRQQLPVAT